ncbi:HEM4 [Candida jiufengensis]|uniref:HEM4 n=1 Tax=Candida jiufengensis TaxID=497108 RepID=UPI0022252F15|nr:HEM4 [Candida jiufengensis]KAI5952860.1 HEM4 [Candida jiufengensis]
MTQKVILLKNPSTPKDPYNDLFQSQSNYNPVFIPLLSHTHSPEKETTIKYLQSYEFLNDISIFIITSQRAVEMLGECISELSSEIKHKIFEKIGYTVGPATYKILKEIGFTNVRGGIDAGNGLKLSEIIINEISKSTNIVFFTGEIRKDIIPRKLIESGYLNFKEYVMYKTEEQPKIIDNFIEQFSTSSNGWIVFFSPQGTSKIIEYLKIKEKEEKIFQNWKLASIGPTTEEYLIQEHGLVPKVIAKKPDAFNLVDGILKFDNQEMKTE